MNLFADYSHIRHRTDTILSQTSLYFIPISYELRAMSYERAMNGTMGTTR